MGLTLLAGCVRFGFDRQQAASDAAADQAAASVDQATAERDLALLHELGPDTATDGSLHYDQAVAYAGQYEACAQTPCAPGMHCFPADTPFCMKRCSSASDCATWEICDRPYDSSIFTYCMQPCNGDPDCPEGLWCTGWGPYPGDHCAPLEPAGVGAVCTTDLACQAGTRCIFGYSKTGRCTEICAVSSCPDTHLCVDLLWANREACLRNCEPLDDPVLCASYEVCYPNPVLIRAYCINADPSETDCNTTGLVCVTGKSCIYGTCLDDCDDAHPCPEEQRCVPSTYDGQDLPWKICIDR